MSSEDKGKKENSELKDKVILITGASSGIGKAIALSLAKHQPKLVIFARREKKLMQTAKSLKQQGVKLLPIVGDIRNREDRNKLVDASLRAFGNIDILINNAGLGRANLFVDQPEEEIDELIDTNFLSLVKLTQKVAQIMKEQQSGHIVNMSTSLVMLPTYPFAVYCATKSAIMTFGDAIRKEMEDYGVKVSTIFPGPYNTDFHEVAHCDKDKFEVYDVGKLADKIVQLLLKPQDNLIQPWFFSLYSWFAKRSKKFKKAISNMIGDSILQSKQEKENKLQIEEKIERKKEVQVIIQ
ncbi:SDR family NAD(P)-dependent oxidoreductase [Candidatus Heimdallarchaeota archaeon]|nr:MAG: SDR family NAD(P)-dependent oxidoreductase [Candidatus Heimdallarchaeota archaeon]